MRRVDTNDPTLTVDEVNRRVDYSLRYALAFVPPVVCLLLGIIVGHVSDVQAGEARDGLWLDSVYWSVITMSTVGFGDLYPTTTFGKVIGTFTMLSGVLVLALPITIVGSNFAHEYEKKSRLSKVYAQSLKKEKARRGVNVGRAIRRKLTGRTSPGAKAESEPVVRRRHTRLLSRRRHSSVHASYTTGE